MLILITAYSRHMTMTGQTEVWRVLMADYQVYLPMVRYTPQSKALDRLVMDTLAWKYSEYSMRNTPKQ